MVDRTSVSGDRVHRLRVLAVVAEWVRLDRRVELDGALQDAELDVQLLGGVVADQELSDVHVHRAVRREQILAEKTCVVLDAETGVQIHAALRIAFSPLVMPDGS